MLEKILKDAAIISVDSDEMMKTHCEAEPETRKMWIDFRMKALWNLIPLLAEYNNFDLVGAEMDELTLLLIEELLKEVNNLRETTHLFEEWMRECPV